ncbi:MAG TPA: HAD family hydrolase, partial [Miltoncostaeaceae bacterium]|nr:HAD family hydrolase [Miltoncostaeaceae bacterium]
MRRGTPAAGRPPARAVLIDAMGTLVRLDDPVGRLGAALAAAGRPNPPDVVAAALRREIAYYRVHMLRGADAAGLAALRRDCARVLAGALHDPPPLEELTALLVGALVVRPFPEVPAVLAALHAAGTRTVVVSDWDCGLGAHLAGAGLLPTLDGVVTSAEVGAAKPDGRVFAAALARAGVAAHEALHVGDDPVRDVAGARAAGIPALLVDRRGAVPPAPHVLP